MWISESMNLYRPVLSGKYPPEVRDRICFHSGLFLPLCQQHCHIFCVQRSLFAILAEKPLDIVTILCYAMCQEENSRPIYTLNTPGGMNYGKDLNLSDQRNAKRKEDKPKAVMYAALVFIITFAIALFISYLIFIGG